MEEEDGTVPPLRSRRRRVALGLALLLVLALAALWSDRRTIATRYVDAALARAGVPARYRVADLGLGRQRLTDVVIGDPADPDLVADWVETRVRYDLRGAELQMLAAGHLRLRARWTDGRISLGAIDRLLPAPSGKAFALPALGVDLADARIRLETPAGPVGLKLAGTGRLDGGFRGSVAALAPALALGGCRLGGATAAMRLVTIAADQRSGQRVTLTGPLGLARGDCAGVSLAALRSDTDATLLLGEPRGSAVQARLATGEVIHRQGRTRGIAGTVALVHAGGRAASGRIDLAAREVAGFGVAARALALDGRVAWSGAGPRFDGDAGVTGADLRRLLPRLDGVAAGTPAVPLVAQLARALATGARSVSAGARLYVRGGDDAALLVRSARADAVGGARATLGGRGGDAIDWRARGGLRLAAQATISGGGLPDIDLRLARSAPGAALRGSARIAPYAAPGARIALAPVAFVAAADRGMRITTRAELSGPLGDGRVEALALPIDLAGDGRGRWRLDPDCVSLAWRQLAVGGLVLDPARLRLCPLGDALVRGDRGRIAGGVRIDATRLAGRLGDTPLTLATGAASLGLDTRGFAVAAVAARLGAPGRESRLNLGTLTGRLGDGVSGSFADGGGRIANVPLILSATTGRWRLANGTLALADTAMTVADEAAAPRFRPLAARAVALTLTGGRIAAAGTLHEPTTGARVAEVRLEHALSPGTGSAAIAVPGLAFREGFQPELLSPLTFGVVADVRGTVTGDARIAWGPDGVRSTGSFGTEALDLAAAFGPVTGIATRLRFVDLLGMRTAPGQVATVRTVNPGIPVEDGTVRYALEGPTLVRVEGARWPFAGGALSLDPTLLDFSGEAERRMTFRVDGAGAAAFLQQFDFGNLNATGTFDGVLPMVFGEAGGRIEDGRLTMRQGGGTLAYVGALGQEKLGFWGDLAFQALKSLRYRSLDVTLNGPLAGEMVTDVRFAGVSQGEGAKSNFLIRRLQRLPFVFNIRITAPFRGLLDSAQSFYDPRRLIGRNLPALLEEQNRRAAPPLTSPSVPTPPVQPPSSEIKR